MSHRNSCSLSAYNSLADKHLAGYFNNTRIRRHLQRAGLITRSGGIVPEKELRHKLIRRDHQRRVRACLSQAIFHKVLDVERHRRIEIKRRLEDFARKEHVHKMKVQRSKRNSDGVVPLISPKPPPGPRNKHTLHAGTEVEQSESSISPGSSQPSSAPGRRQRPVRLQPLRSNSTTASAQRASHRCRREDSANDAEPYHCRTLNRDTRRHGIMPEFSSGISPYRLPVINNYVTPIPPPTNRNERSSKGATNRRTRGRSLRPSTAPDVPPLAKQDSGFHKKAVNSNVTVNMAFYGKAVHLTPDTVDRRDEVKVFQQHCGGENLCVYRGKLAAGEAFQFVSRRHPGFPFSLTFFLNGMQVERLSSCCEFRHRKGSRLGGRLGRFGFTSVDDAAPCFRCIIASGLDKKPAPPPRRLLRRDTDTADTAGSSPFQTAAVSGKARAAEAAEHPRSHPESSLARAEHHATDTEPQENHPEQNEREAQDDYEEDFEEEDEKTEEDAEKARACALADGVSPYPPQAGGDSRSDSREDGAVDHHGREDDEEGRRSDSEAGEGKTKENKFASACSRSISPFSRSRKEDTDSEVEEVKEAIRDYRVDPYSRAEYPPELGRNSQPVQDPKTGQGGDTIAPARGDMPEEEGNPAMGAVGETEDQPGAFSHPTSTRGRDSETQEVHGDDASEASLEESDDWITSEEKEATKWSGAKPEEDTGGTKRAKSVQEKLTAAVSKETHLSSERGLSDSSSDEDEPPTIIPDRTPEPDGTDTSMAASGVATPAVAENINAEEKAASRDGALNIYQTPLEGGLRTLETGEEQEDQWTEEACPDMEVEEAFGDMVLPSQVPVEKGEESEEEAQNRSSETDSQTDPTGTVKVGTAAREGNWAGQMGEDSGTLTVGSGLTVEVIEEGKMNEHESERGQKEDPEATVPIEATAFTFEKQDVKAEDTAEDEEMVERAEETAVTVAEIRARHPSETTEISNVEGEMGAEQETTGSVNGEVDVVDGEKDSAEGENEEAEIAEETSEDQVEEEDGGEAPLGAGDTEAKTEMMGDKNKEKLSQAMGEEHNEKTEQFVNTGAIDDKEEFVEMMTPDMGVNEASTGELKPRAGEEESRTASDPNTEVWQAKCDKIANMPEDSEAADIHVEETGNISFGNSAMEKENTDRGSSVSEKAEGLEGESEVAESVEVSEEMSAKEGSPIRDTETEANGSETEIKEAEVDVRCAEVGSSGEKIGDTPVGKMPRSEINEDHTLGRESRLSETNMTSATAQEAETRPEEPLDMTEGTLSEVGYAGRGMKNTDTVDQREGEEDAVESSRADVESSRADVESSRADVESSRADVESSRADVESSRADVESSGADVESSRADVESSRADVAARPPGKVETRLMAVDHPDEHDLSNTETGGLEVGEARLPSEKNTKTETEVDGIDVTKGTADMKEEEQKVRAAVEAGTRPEDKEVDIDMKGLPDESPSHSELQEKTRVVMSDGTGSGLELKSDDESGHQALQLEEIEERNKETLEVDADVTECNVEGSESTLEDSWLNTDHRDPHGQGEGSLNSTAVSGGEVIEKTVIEGTGISCKPGGAALEVESSTAKSRADGLKDSLEERRRKTDEDEEVTTERDERRNAVALESAWTAEKSRVDSERSVSRSKTELGKVAIFPPPLIRRSRSYALTMAREGLSLQKFAVNDREMESPLAYAQTAAGIAGNSFTASNQKLQSISTKDL